MDMTVTSCWGCGPDLLEYCIAAAIVFFAPVGAFVLRKHIAAAVGPWRWIGRTFQAVAAVSLPFALLLILGIVSYL